jgi:poly(A) polymerase
LSDHFLFPINYDTLRAVTTFRSTIIPRADHPISRRNLNDNAVRVLYRLRDNGFQAFLVGGCIRDLLLGREPKDFDIATSATPSQVKKLFRNCRLVGRRFRLAHLHFRDEIIEVSTFRSASTGESEPEDFPVGTGRPPRIVKDDGGMILRDNLFGTPEEDARRRDFTVNALCYNIADFSLIDYVGGLDDLNRGIIRTIGDPAVRFIEDPVRMLRAIRFAALLSFEIEPDTWRSLVDLSRHCANASPPRLYEEMLKLFLSGEGERCYQLLRLSGVFTALFPTLNSWLETETEGFPHVRFGQALEVIDARITAGEPLSPPLLLALLFGEYLEEQASLLRKEGASPQVALDIAVARFMEDLAPTVQIPHKIALGMRGILACRHRFSGTPGRRPLSFISRPGFDEAFRYLELTTTLSDEAKTLHAWWVRYLVGNPPPTATSPEEISEPDSPRRKRRNRRRRRNTPVAPPHP